MVTIAQQVLRTIKAGTPWRTALAHHEPVETTYHGIRSWTFNDGSRVWRSGGSHTLHSAPAPQEKHA